MDEHKIAYYETTPGIWGLSFAGIWLEDESHYDQAKSIVDDYQATRYEKAVEQRKIAQECGELITWSQTLRKHPVKVTAVIVFVGIVLYLTITPFFFGQFG